MNSDRMPARTEKIDKQKYSAYFRKATSFFMLMKEALNDSNWAGSALAGIHCAISSADALTSFHLGERSRGERHEDVISLLKQANIPGTDEKCRQFSAILSVKNLVEYEARDFYEEDALKLAKLVERFYSWAKSSLP